VEDQDALDASTNWLRLENLPPVSASGDYTVTNVATSSPTRFYRVTTPTQP